MPPEPLGPPTSPSDGIAAPNAMAVAPPSLAGGSRRTGEWPAPKLIPPPPRSTEGVRESALPPEVAPVSQVGAWPGQAAAFAPGVMAEIADFDGRQSSLPEDASGRPSIRPSGVFDPRMTGASPRLIICSSCSLSTDKGPVCPRCGWDNATKKRVCRQCAGEFQVSSTFSRRRLRFLIGGIVVALLAVALGLVIAPIFALTAMALYGAIVAIMDFRAVRLVCAKCALEVELERLQPNERAPYRAARIKRGGLAAAFVVMTAGTPFLASVTAPVLVHPSFGVTWRLRVPRTHREVGYAVRTVDLGGKSLRMLVHNATRPYIGTTTYFFVSVLLGDDVAVSETAANAALNQSFAPVETTLFAGTARPTSEASLLGRKALRASFDGRYEGRPVVGEIRGVASQDRLVFVIVTAPTADEAHVALDDVAPRLELLASP